MPATKRKFAAPVGLLINSISTVDSSVASTTPSSGAFVITGGVGIGGTANITGSVNLWNSTNTFYTGFRAGTLTTSTFYILPTNFPGTGTSVLQSNTSGTLSWVPMTASGSGTTSANINIILAGTNASHPVLFTPSSSSSGSAVSSNSTLVYNPSTDILSVSGLAVTAATGSSNTTTGALVVTGGVGIGGSLNVSNKARFADEVTLTSISSNALSILGSGSVSYTWTVGTTLTSGRYNLGSDLCLVPIGGSQSAIQTFWGMQLVGNNQNVPTSYSPTAVGARDAFGVLIPNQQAASVGLAVIAHASQTADLQIWTTPSGLATTTYLAVKSNGQLYSYTSLGSTSTTTGALVITGGVGIGGSLFVGGQNRFSGARNSTSTTSGTVVVDGGLGITGNAFIGGTVNILGQTVISSSLGSTNNTTGALVVTGGLGVSGQLSFVAASMGFTGITYNPTMAFIGNTSSSPITLSVLTDNSLSWEGTSGQLFAIDNNLTTGDIFSVSDISGLPIINASAGQTVSINEFGGFTRIGNGSISSTGASALGANGSLVVYGGIGITGNAFIGGTFYSTSTGFFNNSTTSTSTSTGTLIVGGGVGIGGSVYIGGQSRLSGARNATSTASGTLVIDGGIGITGNAFIGGTTNIAGQTVISSSIAPTNSNSGALVVSGGVGIGQSLFVGGNLNLTGTFYSGTNTFTKNLGNGDISLDNGSSDTPSITFYWGNNKNLGIDTYWAGSGVTRFRITKELNEVGGGELWSVDRNGIVTQTAWDVGEVINTRVYNNTDLNMSATTTINSTTYTNVATITYTPKSTTSHLWIEFDAHYDFSNGTTTDDFFSRITVGGSAIVEKNQIMVGQVGGGTRSGTIFPISGRYTNTTTSGIAITVQAKWGSADDAIRVYGSSTSGYMRIQEIGR